MQQPSTVRLWTALAIVYVVWGSTYLAIKLAVRTLPPLLTGGTRFAVAAVLLGAAVAATGRSLRVPRREALSALAVGGLMLGAGVGLVHVAETRIDSSVAAMIAGSVPLQVVLWRTLARQRVAASTRLAAVAGLAGLALVVVPGGTEGGSTAVGLAVMVCASLAWSVGSFASTRLRLPRDPFVATVYEMLAGAVLLVAAALAAGEAGDVGRGDLQAGPLAAWLYLAVFGSVVGFTAYVWLLRHAPISQVVTHQYVNPIVAIALGALLLGERIDAAAAVGAAVVLVAVFVTVRTEARRSRPAAAAPAVDSAA